MWRKNVIDTLGRLGYFDWTFCLVLKKNTYRFIDVKLRQHVDFEIIIESHSVFTNILLAVFALVA